MSDDELWAELAKTLRDGVEYGEFHVTYFTRTHAKLIIDSLLPVVLREIEIRVSEALEGGEKP